MFNQIEDLSQEFFPIPKPSKKPKALPKPINKIGKKGREDILARNENKERLDKLGIHECEVKFPKICWRNNALTFAHPAKRRKLTKEDLRVVIVACQPCHSEIEGWKPDEMKMFIEKIIAERKTK